jgi:SNF2 family DNA or RNA helicase
LETFQGIDHSKCRECDTDLFKNPDADFIGVMLECYCILCPDCVDSFKNKVAEIKEGQSFECPFCQQKERENYVELFQPRYLDLTTRRLEQIKKKSCRKLIHRYEGPSSKTNTLIQSLIQSRNEDKTDPDSTKPPNKSVIFTAWTTYLDLIEIALEDNDFKYVRLDGRMNRQARKRSIEQFNTDPETTVFIATIGTGGLGLNLTIANTVYIMEPQWNPAAEAQAVDRVHRLGQKREVRCIRFVVRDSIEPGIHMMQKKKLDLAELSMSKRKLDKVETAKERLMNLVSLFK